VDRGEPNHRLATARPASGPAATEAGPPVEHVARDWERRLFQRCRRAWDLGARDRRNLVPASGDASAAVVRAIRDALAVYYFPGMWGWDRTIVQGLTLKALRRTLETEATRIREGAGHFEEAAWETARQDADDLLRHYFDWAPTVDRLEPLRVEAEFDVPIPDADDPDHDLTSADGGRCRYGGRIDMLVVDPTGAIWVAAHRILPDRRATLTELLMDDDLLSKAWAWQRIALATRIAGTIHTEVGPGLEPSGADDELMPAAVIRSEAGPFRRTWIPRAQAAYAAVGRIVGQQALRMADPMVAVDPSPGPDVCPACPYLAPCVMMFQGLPPEAMLRAEFMERPQPESEPGRLGNVSWSIGRGAAPPRFGTGRGSKDRG